MKKQVLLLAVLGLFSLTAILILCRSIHLLQIPIQVITWLRWFSTAILLVYTARSRSLTLWIFTGMLLGAQLGFDFPVFSRSLHVLSDVFLRLIKTIISPLLFATLVYGIAGHADLKQVGRMGWKSLLYFEVVTTFALMIGLICINVSKAGSGIQTPSDLHEKIALAAKPSTTDVILHIFPENIAKSVAEGQILQVVIFSILFGIGLAMLPEKTKKPLIDFSHSLAETMFKFTGIVMYLAPLAVTGAIAYTVANLGLGIVSNLLSLLATLYIALLLFLLLILLPIALIAGVPVIQFLKAVSEPVSIAFATSSSEAALPKAMLAIERFGVPQRIVSFVMPAGYSFNQDGSTLYLSLATVFIAQAAGKSLTFTEEVVMVLTLTLSSKGVAGVPRAPFAILAGMTASFGLPAWPIFILFGIDALMDMARTSVNVLGNCLATIVIARTENEFNRDMALAWDQNELEVQLHTLEPKD